MTGIGLVKNIAVMAAMIICAFGLLVYGVASKAGRTSSGRIRVLVDGKIYTETEIRNGQKIVVDQPDGCENVILMTQNGFKMLSANCHNHDCIRQGEVTETNYMFRALGTSIICIPNRVEVQLILSEDTEKPDSDYPDA